MKEPTSTAESSSKATVAETEPLGGEVRRLLGGSRGEGLRDGCRGGFTVQVTDDMGLEERLPFFLLVLKAV